MSHPRSQGQRRRRWRWARRPAAAAATDGGGGGGGGCRCVPSSSPAAPRVVISIYLTPHDGGTTPRMPRVYIRSFARKRTHCVSFAPIELYFRTAKRFAQTDAGQEGLSSLWAWPVAPRRAWWGSEEHPRSEEGLESPHCNGARDSGGQDDNPNRPMQPSGCFPAPP